MSLKTLLDETQARLLMVLKLQWVIIAGVFALLLKAYVFGA